MQRLFPKNTFVAPRLVPGNRIIIGEAPREEDSKEGEPFVGGDGRILRGLRVKDDKTGVWKRYGGLLGEAGLKDADISYINTIQCRPPDDIFPTDNKASGYITHQDGTASVAQCIQRHVLPTLRSRVWARIDLLGVKALKYLGEKREDILAWRGSPIAIPALDPTRTIAIPTIHPKDLMRDQRFMVAAVNDLRKSTVVPPERYNLYPTLEQLRLFDAAAYDHITYDIETNWPRSPDITMIGFSVKPYEVMVVPWQGAFITEIKRIFRNARRLVGHNSIQFDNPYVHNYGCEFSPLIEEDDTMLMQHLLQPDMPHDLTFLGSTFTSKPTWEYDRRKDERLYNARDVDVTEQSYRQLKPMLEMHGLWDLYSLVQIPLGKICKLMSTTGIALDTGRLGAVRERNAIEMVRLEESLPAELKTVYKEVKKRSPAPPGTLSEKTGKPLKFIMLPATKKEIPWRSPDRVAEYLYETCQVPVEKDLKTDNITTGKIAMAKISRRLENGTYRVDNAADIHKAVVAIQRLKQLDELDSNFCQEEYLGIKRIHPGFNVHGTSTGRLSSSGPNLQNVPETARYIYVPSYPEWSLLSVDFSGIENRITAHLAGDTERLARFDSVPGFSEHKYATSIFFDIPYEQVVKDNDRTAPYGRAKAIVHGSDRGEGSRKIALLNDIPENEVKPLHQKWKNAIPKTIAWQSQIAAQCAKDGFLANPFGRRWWGFGNRMYTQSISFMPQSTAADVIFRVMIGLMYERIGWPREKVARIINVYDPLPTPARLLLQVHDELVFELPSDMVAEVVEILKRTMQQPWAELGGLILPIAISVGPSWAEMKGLKI